MPAATEISTSPRHRNLHRAAMLIALLLLVTGGTFLTLRREGYYVRALEMQRWELLWKGRYYFDASQGVFRQARTKERLVALTFDDGPHPECPKLLDVLKQYDAHATFFVVGTNVLKHPECARRMVADGNEIGNHTRDHLRLPPLRDDQIRAELNNDTIVIQRVTGRRVRLFRPPGGQYDGRVTSEAARQGMLTVLWSNNTGDWQAEDPRWITRRVLSGLQPGDVILMHEDTPETLAAMPAILEGLRARGYRAVTVSELLRSHGIAPPAPAVSASRHRG